jgi:bifunctional DNA-binding transcriptional regulator/antitoxin component of YhaV-PrlF toxin-antitoxin module
MKKYKVVWYKIYLPNAVREALNIKNGDSAIWEIININNIQLVTLKKDPLNSIRVISVGEKNKE